MRPSAAFLLLLLVAPVCAQEEADDPLRRFGIAMERFREGEPPDAVNSELERVVEQADIRAVSVLAGALVESMRTVDAWMEERAVAQQAVTEMAERQQLLEEEIGELQMREKGGERGLAPAMARKRREQERCMQIYGRSQAKVGRIDSQVTEMGKVRQAILDGCGDVLARLEPDANLGAVYTDLTGKLPPSDEAKSLYLVRILARAARPDADPILIAILEGERVAEGTKRLAISALSRSGSDAALRALLATWERQPDEWGRIVAHVLSLHAGRRLASPEEARAWLSERATEPPPEETR